MKKVKLGWVGSGFVGQLAHLKNYLNIHNIQTPSIKEQLTWKGPGCVGLSWIGKRKHRSTVWSDGVSRPWPLLYRFLPTSWVTWNSKGCLLKVLDKGKY